MASDRAMDSHSGSALVSECPKASNPAPPHPSKPTVNETETIASVNHDIQLRYRLAPSTLVTLSRLPQSPERRQVLMQACSATEFRTFPIKLAEKGLLRAINDHTDIPYPVAGLVSEPWHKVFLLVQIDLQKTAWPNKISAGARRDLHKERGRIYRLLDQVLRCIVDIFGQRQDGRGVIVALDVLRSVKAGTWEGGGNDLLQVTGLGQVKKERLVRANIKTIKQLAKLEFYHIERLLSRNPPFGHNLLHQVTGFPSLTLNVDIVSFGTLPDRPTIQETRNTKATGVCLVPHTIARISLGYENEALPFWNSKHPWTTLVIEGDGDKLLWFWRGSIKRLSGGKELVVGLDAQKSGQIKVSFACEEIVGTILRETYTT